MLTIIRKIMFIGANLNVYNLSIQNYNSATALGIDIGAMAYLSEIPSVGILSEKI